MSLASAPTEGTASRGVALAVGCCGALALCALACAIVFVPDTLTPGRIVAGTICAMVGAALPPIQLLDARRRRHSLTDTSVVYRHGLVVAHEIEIPFAHVHAVAVRQSLMQKLFGCGDVRVTTQGVVPNAGLVTAADANSLVLRSIPDHDGFGNTLRERMRECAGN